MLSDPLGVRLVVELAVYDGVLEMVLVALPEGSVVRLNVGLAETEAEDDRLSLWVELTVLLTVTLGESDTLCVALPLRLLDRDAEPEAKDGGEKEAVAVVLTLRLNDTVADSEVDEVPVNVRETDTVGVTLNVSEGVVVIVDVLLGEMLHVALAELLTVVEVLRE